MENPRCPECYPLTIPACADSFTVPTGLDPLTMVWATITDKFGNIYRITGITDDNGAIDVDASAFPPGLFTPFSGSFKFEIWGLGTTQPTSPACGTIDLNICDNSYSCVTITAANISYPEGGGPYPGPDPDPTCICSYAFGFPSYEFTKDELGTGDISVTLHADTGDFYASSDLLGLGWEAEYWIGGVMIQTFSGILNPGEQMETNMGGGDFSIAFFVQAIFEDGAIVYGGNVAEFTQGEPIGEHVAPLFTPMNTEIDCAEFSGEIVNPGIFPIAAGRSFEQSWRRDEDTILSTTNEYEGEIPNETPPPFVDLAYVMEINQSEWRDFAWDEGSDGPLIGVLSDFVFCDDNGGGYGYGYEYENEP